MIKRFHAKAQRREGAKVFEQIYLNVFSFPNPSHQGQGVLRQTLHENMGGLEVLMGLNGKMFWLFLSLLLLPCGCVDLKQSAARINYFTLEYDSPVIPDLASLPVVIKVTPFSVAPLYNTTRIIYRDGSYKRDEYFYYKWRANPGALVTYFLRRDITNTGVFNAVLPPDSRSPFSYLLEGAVDQFYEMDEGEHWMAVLSLTITVMDSKDPDVSRNVLFQKTYHKQKPCRQNNPTGLAEAMSLAMKDISSDIIRDIYASINDRMEKGKGSNG